jgi:Tol biopolymer transport system component
MSEVVGRAMAKMPADRYRTVEEFVQALERGPAAPVRSARGQPWVRSRWWQYSVAAAAVVGLLVVSRWYFQTSSTSSQFGSRTERQLTYSGAALDASISPDGRRAAYLIDRQTIVLRDLETGDTSVLARNPNWINATAGLQWRGDGSKILYRAYHPTGSAWYSVATRGGNPETVALSNANLHFGPDDTTYLATLEAAMYIGSAPTTFQILSGDSIVGDGTVIDLKREFAWITYSRPSPDGRWIASLAIRPGGEVVLLTIARDGRHTVVVPDLGVPSSPVDGWSLQLCWSADSRTIYFPRPQGLGWSIWSVEIDPKTGAAKGTSRLLAERLPSSLSFGLSGDGRRLVYSGGPTDIQLSRFRLGTRGKVESALTLTTGTSLHKGPGLSPDGSQVAYIRQDQDGRGDLFLVSIDGGQERRLTSTGLRKGSVAWSPDGQSIAFVELRKPQAVLVLVDIASGRMTQLGRGPGEVLGNELAPVWSPDGRTILYQASGSRNYFVVDRTTGAERRLVTDESVGWLFSPVFAPQGRRVAAMWHRPPKAYLWSLGLDDGSQRRLPGDQVPGYPITWGRDSLIYLEGGVDSVAGAGKGTTIHRRDPATGRTTVFAHLPMECLSGEIAISRDARTLVCPTMKLATDVWLSTPEPSR